MVNQHNHIAKATLEPRQSSTSPKSSLQISLILLSGLALSACGSEPQTEYQYANRDDCVKDWGETECPQQSSGSGGGYHGSRYYYYRNGYHNSDHAMHAKSAVSRGGFGSFGRGGS